MFSNLVVAQEPLTFRKVNSSCSSFPFTSPFSNSRKFGTKPLPGLTCLETREDSLSEDGPLSSQSSRGLGSCLTFPLKWGKHAACWQNDLNAEGFSLNKLNLEEFANKWKSCQSTDNQFLFPVKQEPGGNGNDKNISPEHCDRYQTLHKHDRSTTVISCPNHTSRPSGRRNQTVSHFNPGRISCFCPGSCFPNWLQGKPSTVNPSGFISSWSAFSSVGRSHIYRGQFTARVWRESHNPLFFSLELFFPPNTD